MSKFTLFGFFVLLFVIQISAQRQAGSSSNDVEKPQKEQGPDTEQSPVVRKTRARKPKLDKKTVRQLRTDSSLSSFPCTCEKTKCNCCAKVDIPALDFHQKGCAEIAYDPEDVGIDYAFSFNNRQIYRNEVSGNDIPVQCAPLPRWPMITICARYHSTQISPNNVRFCLTMEAVFRGMVFYRMDFDCVNNPINPSTTPAPGRGRSVKKSKND